VCDLESPDNARKGLVHKRSVFTVVVIHVPSDLFGSYWWALVAFGLVVVYFGVRRLLLVTGRRLFTIWVDFLLQTGVAACVLLLGFVFLLVCFWVVVCFLARWFGSAVSASFDGLWVYSLWLLLRNVMVMIVVFLGDFQPRCLALVLVESWCCRGGGGGDA